MSNKFRDKFTKDIENKMKDYTLQSSNSNDCVNVTDISLFQMVNYPFNMQSIIIILYTHVFYVTTTSPSENRFLQRHDLVKGMKKTSY
jgi:hypothetical protein